MANSNIDKFISNINELDSEQHIKLLGVTDKHYTSGRLAKQWYIDTINDIEQRVTSQLTVDAVNVVYEMLRKMLTHKHKC